MNGLLAAALVTVAIHNKAGVPEPTLSAAQAEVERIFASARVRIAWVNAIDPATFGIHVIVRRQPGGGPGAKAPSALGTSIGEDHRQGGVSFVFYDRVLKFAHDGRRSVETILAYAIAHEMGHVLLPPPAHTTTGLMKAEWDEDDVRRLTTGAPAFTPEQITLMNTTIGARPTSRHDTSVPVAAAGPESQTRVRSTDAAILNLLKEGNDRSPTFRSLVAAINQSTGIVYVEFGYCAFGHLDGCLLPYIAVADGDRYLRVIVLRDKNRRSGDRLLALIAHELQHALEVIQHPEVIDEATMDELFSQIGTPLARGRHGYETSAAHAVEDAVLSECAKGELLHIFLTGRPKMVVHDAILGAARRLERAECRRVFTDFVDKNGEPLNPDGDGLTARTIGYFQRLSFVDGDQSAPCGNDESSLAFTEPFGRVIYICAQRFAAAFARKTTGGEILVIHELLHSLGVPENPPSSAEINRRVWARCA